MAADKTTDKLTIDAATLNELVASRVEAELAKRAAQAPPPRDPTQKLLAEAEIVNAEPHPVRFVRMVSMNTGAEFTARVAISRTYPKGRIVNIGENADGQSDYVEPAQYTTHVKNGGFVPDNTPIRDQGNNLTREYMKWKVSNNPWLDDLRYYVGKEWNEAWARAEKVA